MSKLIMMSGLPASGKSTRAKEIIQAGGNWVRLNRDLLRKMLHFDKWSGINEALTVKAMNTLARKFLELGTSVVIDDTNLGDKHRNLWSAVAKECGAKFGVESLLSVPISECIERDRARENGVGKNVITKMALQYGLYPRPEKGFVLCDLDGTIANIEHRLSFVKNVEKKDWKSFFAGIEYDLPRNEVINQVIEYRKKGHEIIFVTARPEDYRDVTEKWLASFVDIDYTALIMRRFKDTRPDTDVKKDMLDTYFVGKTNEQCYPIEVVFDDRPSVIRMWREIGIKVIDVGAGVEF